MNIRQVLTEGNTGRDVNTEKNLTVAAIDKLKKRLLVFDKIVKNTESVDPFYYVSIRGEINRISMSLQRLEDNTRKSEHNTGERW
jgi:hypothetical protein